MFDDENFLPLEAPGTGTLHLSLALQGGGSFGAFTWGVLDRLLEEPTIRFDIASGASAGAVNAVLLADGLRSGGRDGARQALRQFWTRVGQVQPAGLLGLALPAAAAALRITGQMGVTLTANPTAFNPLRDLLDQSVDFAALRADPPIRLLIATTRVHDGRLHLFREQEITRDMVLASACLPMLNKAIEIDGEFYWDGGLSANPPLLDLARETGARDILLVQLMAESRAETPSRSGDIARRLAEIAFTAPLQRDIAALADLRALSAGPGFLQTSPARKLNALRFHRIAAEDLVDDLDEQSAMDTAWPLLARLHDKGREAAARWVTSEA